MDKEHWTLVWVSAVAVSILLFFIFVDLESFIPKPVYAAEVVIDKCYKN